MEAAKAQNWAVEPQEKKIELILRINSPSLFQKREIELRERKN
jgi:hypothetical protein